MLHQTNNAIRQLYFSGYSLHFFPTIQSIVKFCNIFGFMLNLLNKQHSDTLSTLYRLGEYKI